jgi:hypothetical protein
MPCYSVDRKKFDQCLKEINKQQLVIPMNAEVAGKKEIVNETVEVKPINESQISSVEASKPTGKNIFVELLQLIKNFLKIVFQPVD